MRGRGRVLRGAFGAAHNAPPIVRTAPEATRMNSRDSASGPVVLVVTGRNIDDDLHARACEQPRSFPV